MLRAIVHILRFELPRSLAGWVSVCLAALVVAQAVLIGIQLLSAPQVARNQSPRPSASPYDTPRVNVAAIMGAHLFGSPRAAAPLNAATVQPTAANLLLTGTLVSANSGHAGAIVTSDGKSQLYEIGATVGGAVLSRIYPDRIILNRDGLLESLGMPRPDSPGHGRAPLAGLTPGVETRVAADADADTSGDIAQVMRAGGAVLNEEGQMRGFRIYPGKDRSAFLAAGLRGGDVVVAVNGASVLDQHRSGSQELFRSISHAARGTMTIERNGATREVTVDSAQGASPVQPLAPAGIEPATTVD